MNWKDPQPCSGNKHDTLISQLVLKAHAGHKALVTLICRIAWLGRDVMGQHNGTGDQPPQPGSSLCEVAYTLNTGHLHLPGSVR